jgi:hypothetical protein
MHRDSPFLGGSTFKIILDAPLPTAGEAKAEIARTQGITRAYLLFEYAKKEQA